MVLPAGSHTVGASEGQHVTGCSKWRGHDTRSLNGTVGITVSAISGVLTSASLAWRGRNEGSLKRHLCVSLCHTTETKDSSKMGMSLGILHCEREKVPASGRTRVQGRDTTQF